MNFHKYQAIGNDYLVIEGATEQLTSSLVRRICDRHFGLGSDGILLGGQAPAGRGFDLRIFNPDGSEAIKSGNGIRIFARYLWDSGLVMKANRLRMLSRILLFILLLLVLPGKIYAKEKIDRNGFVLGGWTGYGQMNVHTDNTSRNSYGTFALGFKGGYAITSTAIIGLELNGWTLKGYNINDPSKGESVSNVSLFINYFPLDTLPLYIAVGGGQVSYTNNSPEVNGRDKGGSWFIGSGYEIKITNKVMLVPQIRYSQGNFTGGNFKVYELALGINWYL